MFEHLDDTEGTPFGLALPAEARRRAARMQARRRALGAAAMAVILVAGVGLAANLSGGRTDPDVKAVAPDRDTGDVRDGPSTALDQPTTSTTPPSSDNPSPTTAPPDGTTNPTLPEHSDGTPQVDGVTVEASNTLTPEAGSTATGQVHAQALSSTSWRISVRVDGAGPNVAHAVSVQHRTPDGGLSEIRHVCQARSDTDGSFSCQGSASFDELVRPALVTVMREDPPSGGYLAIGSAGLDAG